MSGPESIQGEPSPHRVAMEVVRSKTRSFRLFNLTFLFKHKLSQSCKQWQSRQLPRKPLELLCFPSATSPQPLNLLCESGSSTKSPKLSFKVAEPQLRGNPCTQEE